MPERELLMIEPQQVQNRRMQIMHVYPILHREMSKLVRFAQ